MDGRSLRILARNVCTRGGEILRRLVAAKDLHRKE